MKGMRPTYRHRERMASLPACLDEISDIEYTRHHEWEMEHKVSQRKFFIECKRLKEQVGDKVAVK